MQYRSEVQGIRCLHPTSVLCALFTTTIQAEVVGFEPTDLSISGFQDRCTKPDYATLPKALSVSENDREQELDGINLLSANDVRYVDCCYRLKSLKQESNPRPIHY
jgi:hypothetical protein